MNLENEIRRKTDIEIVRLKHFGTLEIIIRDDELKEIFREVVWGNSIKSFLLAINKNDYYKQKTRYNKKDFFGITLKCYTKQHSLVKEYRTFYEKNTNKLFKIWKDGDNAKREVILI